LTLCTQVDVGVLLCPGGPRTFGDLFPCGSLTESGILGKHPASSNVPASKASNATGTCFSPLIRYAMPESPTSCTAGGVGGGGTGGSALRVRHWWGTRRCTGGGDGPRAAGVLRVAKVEVLRPRRYGWSGKGRTAGGTEEQLWLLAACGINPAPTSTTPLHTSRGQLCPPFPASAIDESADSRGAGEHGRFQTIFNTRPRWAGSNGIGRDSQ